MKEKIVATQPLKKQILEADEQGISYTESPGFGMGDTFHHAYHEIDAIVRSATEPVLSIQIGSRIYSLRFNQNNEGHRALIGRIVAGAQKSALPTEV